MRRVMIFSPPKSTPTPTPTPSPAPSPPFVLLAPKEDFPFGIAEKQANVNQPLKFYFYVVEGDNQQPQVVCLESSSEIKCLAGPYDSFDIAKKIKENLTNIPPSP